MKGARRLVWCAALALALATGLTGCMGYKLGPTNDATAGARSIQINPLVNKTLQPRLGDYVMESLRKRLQQDGTYRLDNRNEGDIIVSAVITAYGRTALSVQPTDVLTAQDYEIDMTAQVTARERATGKVIFDEAVKGRTTLRVGDDLTSAERQSIPLLADDFAKHATELLVDGKW